MSVETDFVTAILADAGITALIDDRLEPVRIPDDATLPAMSYRLISSVPIGSGNPRCERARIQLDLTAATYTSLKGLRDAVKSFVAGQNAYWCSEATDDWSEPPSDKYHQPLDIFVGF